MHKAVITIALLFASLIPVAAQAATKPHATKTTPQSALEKAVSNLRPLVSDDNMRIVDDCHVLVLDAKDGAQISHASSFTCYHMTHPLYKALLALYIASDDDKWNRSYLASLLKRVNGDDMFFRAHLDPDELDFD